MRSTYQVTIRGRLSPTLLAEFEELGLAAVEPVVTQLCGPVADQAALYGLVRRIEALGLELVELRLCPLPTSEADGPAEPPTR
ncbi:MAG TPA: hypothetical protein VF743_05550 [Acidimicrobiales bacterium]